MFRSWIRHVAHLLGFRSRRRARKPASLRRPERPTIEVLETRTMPSTVTWTGGSGDWSDPTHVHWQDQSDSTFHTPGAADDAVINTAVTVTHSTGSDTAKSLTFGASGV